MPIPLHQPIFLSNAFQSKLQTPAHIFPEHFTIKLPLKNHLIHIDLELALQICHQSFNKSLFLLDVKYVPGTVLGPGVILMTS